MHDRSHGRRRDAETTAKLANRSGLSVGDVIYSGTGTGNFAAHLTEPLLDAGFM